MDPNELEEIKNERNGMTAMSSGLQAFQLDSRPGLPGFLAWK